MTYYDKWKRRIKREFLKSDFNQAGEYNMRNIQVFDSGEVAVGPAGFIKFTDSYYKSAERQKELNG